MAITFQPIAVETNSRDAEGMLVLANGSLVAVLVHLTDEAHAAAERRHWFLEAGFGRCSAAPPPLFADLDVARDWLEERLAHVP